MIKLACVRGGYAKITKAARDMGLEESERLSEIDRRLKDYRAAVRAAKGTRGKFKKRAGMIAGLSLPTARDVVLHPPEITDEDLKPMRVAEHEFIAKIMLGAWTLSLGVLATLTGLYRFRGGVLRRVLAERLGGLLDWRDWAWITGAGVIAPLLTCLVLVHLPSTGAREWSVIAVNFLPPCGVLALGMWLMILLPVLIARWRLSVRAGFAGIAWKRGWIPWLLAGCVLAAMPLVGWGLLPWNFKPAVVYSFAALCWTAQGWMLVVAFRGLFSKRRHLLKRVALSRVVFPAYMLAAILAGVAAVVSHQLEKRAIREDRLTSISAEKPSLSAYEYEVTQIMGQELRELLKTEP
jgi:hypothetical protein